MFFHQNPVLICSFRCGKTRLGFLYPYVASCFEFQCLIQTGYRGVKIYFLIVLQFNELKPFTGMCYQLRKRLCIHALVYYALLFPLLQKHSQARTPSYLHQNDREPVIRPSPRFLWDVRAPDPSRWEGLRSAVLTVTLV